MKICDPSQPWSSEDSNVIEHCSLVFFAKRFEDLPISQRVGDIIRVHRANVGIFKGVKQFSSNIFFNSSWALFSPYSFKDRSKDDQTNAEENKTEEVTSTKKSTSDPREFIPFSYYGKAISFEKSEQKIISSYRDWISKNFPKKSVLSNRFIT